MKVSSSTLLNQLIFNLINFFIKILAKSHHWVDRLVWTDKQWIEYISNKKVKTYVLKKKRDLAGYFELIFHEDKNEIEIAYLGTIRRISKSKIRFISFIISNKKFFFE